MSLPFYLVTGAYAGFKPYQSESHDNISHAKRAALLMLKEADEAREAGELSETVIVVIYRRGQLWARTIVEKRLTPKSEYHDGRCTARLVKGLKP